jgi:biotin operon repressor BirA-like protein
MSCPRCPHCGHKGLTADDVLAELVPGQYVSGEAIARRLGCTRTNVNKHVQRLRRRGYLIVACGRRGTMLAGIPAEQAS